jgi:hypothetical protein
MRKRILISVGAVLLFIAGEVSGVTQAACSGSSLSVLSACVNKNFTSVQSQINSLNTKLTALTTKVTALQNGTVTTAGLVGNYAFISTTYSHDASGGTGLNITYQQVQSTLSLNANMTFAMSQTKNESQLQLGSSTAGQNSTDDLVTVASPVVTSVTSSVTPTNAVKSPTGTWSLLGNTLTLTPDSGNPISFTVANGGRVLMTVDEANGVWLGIQTP